MRFVKLEGLLKRARSSLERIRRSPVASTVLVNGAANVVRLSISLATIPALLRNLGQDGLGIWMIAMSSMGIIGFVNAGLASAVISGVSRATSQKGGRDARNREATSGMVLAAMCGTALIAIGLPLSSFVDWQARLSLVGNISASDVERLMGVLVVTLGVGFPSNVPKFVLLGAMRGPAAYALDLISAIISGLLLLLAILERLPIYWLAFFFLAPQMLTLLAGGALLLRREGISFYRPRDFSFVTFRHLFREGSKLAISQAAFAISTHSDLTLIGIIAGASSAATYGVAQRLFGIPVMFAGILNDALWPALSKADAEGRAEWVRGVFMKVLLITGFLMSVMAIILLIYYDKIVFLWLKQTVTSDWPMLSGFGVCMIINMIVHTSDALLKALRKTGTIAKAMSTMMLINVVLSFLLIHAIGAAGAIWGTVIAYIICLVIPYGQTIRRILWNPPGTAVAAATVERLS
jgi:O-antigen/teichoic acid export membrane protein